MNFLIQQISLQIDYEILEGIYWNEGVSTKINEKIKDIYERRKAAKAQNPPNKIEQIYKMLMNSSYGKCIEMAKPYQCVIVEGQNYINHLFQNYTNIQSIDEIITFDNELRKIEIEEKSLHNQLNPDEKQWLTEMENKTKFIFKEYNQYDNNNELSITFKNCESAHCILEVYIILYINYTSIKIELVTKSERKLENTSRQMKMAIQLFKIYGMHQKHFKWKLHRDIGIL